MPPCAAADEVRGQNLATAVLKAGTLSTTGFDQRNASCPRRLKLARLGGGELLRPRRAAETAAISCTQTSLLEMSQPHSSSEQHGDITPEFSGRAPRFKRTSAALNAGMTVTRMHFIQPGPAATRCYAPRATGRANDSFHSVTRQSDRPR
jgi:hypothetical protein